MAAVKVAVNCSAIALPALATVDGEILEFDVEIFGEAADGLPVFTATFVRTASVDFAVRVPDCVASVCAD